MILKSINDDRTGIAFWKEINKKKNKRENISDKITMEDWINQFKEKDNKEKKKDKENKIINRLKKIEDNYNIISIEEIDNIIKKMKRKKAAGPDEIGNEAWIYSNNETKEDLQYILNKIWRGPVFKKGEKDNTKNYRGITLMDTGYKIYAEILQKRLEKETDEKEIINETQFGFRKGKGTIDAIYCLKTIAKEELKKEKGKVILFFADIKAAFDKIKREDIWKVLDKNKISMNLKERIKEIYEETYARIKIKNKLTDKLEFKNGVRQGCPLSAALFNVVFSDLEESLYKGQIEGCKMGRKEIYSIAYADNIVLIATEENEMKSMLRRFNTRAVR